LHLKRIALTITSAIVVGVSYTYYDMNHSHFISNLINSTSSKEQPVTKITSQESELLISHIASWQDSSIRQLVHYALPKKQILSDMEEEAQNLNTVALVDKVVVIPKINVTNSFIEPISLAVAVIPESKLVAIRDINSVHLNRPQLAKGSVNKPESNQYTIQLVASHNINDVHRFRKDNQLKDTTIIRHFNNAKGTWYVLTLGEYNSINQAQLKVKNLPSKLAKLNPWVRNVSGLANIG
jgi:hypothetical protein